MVNSLGATLVNWFLGMIEKEVCDQHLSFCPSFYVRYVDDAFAIFFNGCSIVLECA